MGRRITTNKIIMPFKGYSGKVVAQLIDKIPLFDPEENCSSEDGKQ